METKKKRLLVVVWLVCGFVIVQGFPENGQYVIEEILDEEIGSVGEDEGFLRAGYLNQTEEPQTRIYYTGSQVWKIKIENSKQLKVLSELRKQNGIFN